ncbi:GDCCVxC domain-containing (seleno)protein [Plebeiibacterium sediminum]|uniref:GDCCVxC domain-containing (seleno)protein n=1 Tax=Plebeiibacterium sediminum TaxID=2992112 RepID=UPI00263B484F|nr:GDCCVxC domain-containing (seleno)protein [Plebeiobacterium sediminum]
MKPILLKSKITCPECGFQKEETMPEDSCQFFYYCEKCKTVLKPKKAIVVKQKKLSVE